MSFSKRIRRKKVNILHLVLMSKVNSNISLKVRGSLYRHTCIMCKEILLVFIDWVDAAPPYLGGLLISHILNKMHTFFIMNYLYFYVNPSVVRVVLFFSSAITI